MILFRPEFLTLPDADGRPLGTLAALVLSQLVWLSENQADEKGWFEWTMTDCETQTGLSRHEQQAVQKRLMAAGYIQTDRRGENGTRHFRVCENWDSRNSANRIAEIRQTGQPKIGKPKGADSRNSANRIAENRQTPSTKEILKEPPASPMGDAAPQGSRASKSQTAFRPPALEQVETYMEQIGSNRSEAAKFHDHFAANGWKIGGKTAMKDWQAACRNWLRNTGRFESERRTRDGPVPSGGQVRDRNAGLEESREELRLWFNGEG